MNEPTVAMKTIRKAIRRGQITTVYQPCIRLRSLEHVRTEALARLVVDGDLVEAGRWLPPIENGPLATDVDLLVLRAVRERVARGGIRDVDRYVVNVSSHTLLDRRGLAAYARALSASGIGDCRISLDVRADLFAAHRGSVLDALDTLGAGGCGFAIDDFDGRPEDLASYADTAVERVKLARALVRRLVDPEGRSHVRDVARAAHDLGLVVVAVGVEDASLFDVCMEAGVDDAFGYHLGMPARDLTSARNVRPHAEALATGATA